MCCTAYRLVTYVKSVNYHRVDDMRSGRSLYRYLLRSTQKLPSNAQPYYRGNIREHFDNHSQETDQVRLHQIRERAEEDAKWILAKYKVEH
ncbi:hypothetical protein ACHWQZ_G012343 [Mnemiopsis leidyi]